MDNEILEAEVLEIQRMSTEDGPGIRTTVFFKGCCLNCTWCHNPESISPKPQVQWIDSRCLGCKLCVKTCPNRALSFYAKGVVIDRTRCLGCGACVEECPSTAMELLGRKWRLDQLLKEVVKDRVFFEKSDGGITVSGGEVTLQAPFIAAFLRSLREDGIHTALDTSGQCAKKTLDLLLPHVDLLLYDIKEIDPEKHKTFTGITNDRILENLRYVASYIKTHRRPDELWIRTPIIPGTTDRAANIRGIGGFITSNLNGVVKRWDLCSFNNLCRDKYVRLGLSWAYKDAELMTKESMEKLAEIARGSGVDPRIVHWSGLTKLETNEPNEPAGTPVRSKPRAVKDGSAC